VFRAVILVSPVMLSWGAMCAGGGIPGMETPPVVAPEPTPAPEPAVVVVPTDGGEVGACCVHQVDGAPRYTLMDGPSSCAERFGEGGTWTTSAECTACCCDEGGRVEEAAAGACVADGGTCVARDRCPAADEPAKVEEGEQDEVDPPSDKEERDDKPTPKPKPRPTPRPRPR
jgi:hypothetical protein